MLPRFVQTQEHPPGQGVPQAERVKALLAVMLGISLSALDNSIVNTALPAMARDLRATEAMSVWIVSSYQLSVVAAMLPLALLGEIWGHRRVFMCGLTLFTVTSVACGLAPTLQWLIAARVAQGVGGAAIMATNMALLRFTVPTEQLGRGVGMNALVVGVSFAAGPTVASAILLVADWPWLFLVRVPLGVLCIAWGLRALPATALARHRFDFVAALLCAAFFASLLYVLNQAAQAGLDWGVALFAVLSLLSLLWLLRRQAGVTAPVLALDLLRRPMFALSVLTAVCSFSTQSLAFVSLPFMLQSVLGYTQVETGFLITPWPAVVALMAPVAGRLSDRYPAGLLAGVGMAMLSFGMAMLAIMPAHPTVADMVWRMVLCGAGFGFFQSPNLRAIMTSAPPERSGGASGMVATARLLGQSFGAALVAACLNVSSAQGAVAALWLGVIFAGVAGAASFMRLRYAPN
jgi:DHA2 family multidrug resistance protein-like MFS transporter